jgi:hypothetical protein
MARWRAWLRGLTTEHAEEWEGEPTPTTRGDDVECIPPPSLDEVLRDAAQQRDPDPRDDREAGQGGPKRS